MLPELAHFCLILAFCAALCQCILYWPNAFTAMRNATYAQALGLSLALIGLAFAFLQNDFSVWYVASHSSRELPWWYRLTAVWGAHEGSILLWATLFSLWSACAAYKARQLAHNQQMLLILGLVNVGLIGFILFTSNPFIRLLPDFPANGRDLNPLLQDPGFLIHPPMLYMGYVGCGVIYAALMVNLIQGKVDDAYMRWLKPWAITAWAFLTLGITLGSWWSYRVLGWGGFWMWDPVENASALPWLALTAFIHSLIVSTKRQTFYASTILLGILSFALSLLGTFLVRSGVLTSVHAFAVDPKRGIFILAYLFIVIASALGLYAWRLPRLVKKTPYRFYSREFAILVNNFLLMTICATVLLGTLYPMVIDALGLGKLSVGAPYFNAVVIPLALPLAILIGIGPYSFWRQDQPRRIIEAIKIPAFLTATVFLLFIFIDREVIVGLTLATWIIASSALHLRHQRKWAMAFAHMGLGVLILGLTVNSHYASETYVKMKLHESVNLSGYEIKLASIDGVSGPNYEAQRGQFTVQHDNKEYVMSSDKRYYQIQHYPMSHPGIMTNILRDIYIALGDQFDDGSWSVRLYFKPGIRFIWLGGLLMVLAGGFAVLRRGEQYDL